MESTFLWFILTIFFTARLSSAQFTPAIKNDYQNIFDNVFLNSRCKDRTRCMMSEWDYVKELTRDMADQFVGPTIYIRPRNFYFNKDNTDNIHLATFMCAARQDFDDIAFYKWYKDGVEVQVTEKPHISLAGGMLEINSPKEEDAGGYYCAATNIAGTSRSRTRNLYAAYVDEFNQGERIKVVSANQVAIIGCDQPNHFKRLDYFWKRQVLAQNGTLLNQYEFIEQNVRFIIDENNGNLYMIKPGREDLNRVYKCVVRNEKEYEQETGSFSFVEGPAVSVRMSQDLPTLNDLSIKFPTDANAEYRTRSTRNITMYCIADGGYDLLTYSWVVPDPDAGNYYYRYQGAKLEIIGATLDNNGEYECYVRNQEREKSIAMKLYVYERPRITKKLENLEARAGQQYTLSCEASAEPAPSYRWYYNGDLITQGSGLSPNGNALEFEQLREEHSGMYQCEAYNEHGNAMSTAQVTVDDVEPIFISQFDFRVDGSLVFEEGYDGRIECRPFAIPRPIFSWSVQSKSIQNDTKYQMWLDGSLHIKSVTGSDNGDYKCTAQGGGNSEAMNFQVSVIPRVDVEMVSSEQTTRVNRSVDLTCQLASDNPSEGQFLWFLNDMQIHPSSHDSIVAIEEHYRRLDKIFGSDDFAHKVQNNLTFAMKEKSPYFYPSSTSGNPFYPPAGPGKFTQNDAQNSQSVRNEREWLEIKQWDPYNPYKSSEQFEKELKAENDTVLRYYGTDIPWYIESQFRTRESLHYILVGDGVKNGTLRLYRPQKWQQGTYKCCYATLYGQTCKEVLVNVIDTPPEPSNVLFNTETMELKWGNPGRAVDLEIEKFLIMAETIALYPYPELMQTLPMDETYTHPDPFSPVEGAFLPPTGFRTIAEADSSASRIDLSSVLTGYNTMRFKVVSVNAVGQSVPSVQTVDIVIPQSKPRMVVQNIRAGHALRAAKKRLLAVAFDPVPVNEFGADNCYFNVYYREKGSNSDFIVQPMRSPFQTQITIELSSGSQFGSSTSRALKDYEVQIEIVNEKGAGPKSQIVTVQEVPLPTEQSVTNVQVAPTSGTSVLVTFLGIDISQEPTFVGYQVEFFKYSENDFDVTNFNFEFSEGNSTRKQEVHVYDLNPAMNYKFRVYAVNAGGRGPASEQVFGETYMAQPSEQPQDVMVYSYEGDTTVRVQWSPVFVKDAEAQLEGYRVFYWLMGIPDNESAYFDWRRDMENDEEAFLKDLVPGSRYFIIVQPFSKGGFGTRSEPFPFLMRETKYNELYESGAIITQPMAPVLFFALTILTSTAANYFTFPI